MDWNNDGLPDLIFGERNGNIRLYQRNSGGTLHFTGNIYDDQGYEIKSNYNSSPWLVDWNEDGKLDLLFAGYTTESTSGGFIRVYPNVGDDPDSPVFSASYLDYTSFYNKWRTTAQTFDLNGDGRKDLILGYEMGEVYFAPNIGTNQDPQFSSYSVLQSAGGPMNVYTTFSGGGRARPHVADYNSDGIPDVLVGCNSGWIYVFLGNTTGIGERSSGVDGGLSLSLLESPASGVVPFSLRLPAGVAARVSVYDLSGRRVLSISEFSGGEGLLDLRESPPGIYIVTAESGGATTRARLTLLGD